VFDAHDEASLRRGRRPIQQRLSRQDIVVPNSVTLSRVRQKRVRTDVGGRVVVVEDVFAAADRVRCVSVLREISKDDQRRERMERAFSLLQ
jgi:hypothetical protein